MGFLRERDFSRDQPCKTRLLTRLESHMVSWEKFAEVVGTWRVSGERHVLYLTSYVRTEQVWSRMSRETRLARRDHGLTVSSCVSSRKLRVSKNGTYQKMGLRASQKPQHTPPKNSENGRTATVRPPPPWLYLAITWPKIIPQKMLSNRNTRHERARHQATRRGVARRIYHSMASLLHC